MKNEHHPMAGAYETTFDGKRVRIAIDPKRWDDLMLSLARRARHAKAKKATQVTRLYRPRRCSHCGRFLGRYAIVAPAGVACPLCGPRVDGGAIQTDAQRYLERFVALR